MGFIDSYKHLEKLCGEIMNDEKKVTAYINEMRKILDGSYFVEEWDEDLNKLKKYRDIRNKIVHDPECMEDNMSKPEDVYWLEDFYSRIINQQNLLSLYYKNSRFAY